MIRNPNEGRYKSLHLDVCIDERTPRHGISQLLKTLRPEWKPEDIQVKASSLSKLLDIILTLTHLKKINK